MNGKRGAVNESKRYDKGMIFIVLAARWFKPGAFSMCDVDNYRLLRPLMRLAFWISAKLTGLTRLTMRLGFTSKRPASLMNWLTFSPLMTVAALIVIAKMLTQLFRRQSQVSGAPGSFLCRLADFLCSKKTKQEIADPIIADMQFEYYDALFAHRRAKAAWIRVRGCCAFFHALGLHRILKGVAGLFQQVRPR